MKYIPTYESFLNETQLTDLVGKNYKYQIGSSTESLISSNTEEWILSKIEEMIQHYLYDSDFSLNYLDNSTRKVYQTVFKSEVLDPMIKNVNNTLKKFFELKGNTLHWKLSKADTQKLIDDFFIKNKKLPADIVKEYKLYRLDYAGVNL